jgi:hypothetical protein
VFIGKEPGWRRHRTLVDQRQRDFIRQEEPFAKRISTTEPDKRLVGSNQAVVMATLCNRFYNPNSTDLLTPGIRGLGRGALKVKGQSYYVMDPGNNGQSDC